LVAPPVPVKVNLPAVPFEITSELARVIDPPDTKDGTVGTIVPKLNESNRVELDKVTVLPVKASFRSSLFSVKISALSVMLEIVPLYSNRYSPTVDEVVIGVVVAKNFENFTIDINCEYGHANLNTMEFQGATKTNKPKYEEGTLVICRVLKVEKFASKIVELT
jgi:hypothetical protein